MNIEQIDDVLYSPEINSYNRLDAFIIKCRGAKGKEYWYGLKSALINSDNLYERRSVLKKLINKDEPHKDSLMTESDKDYLKKLPNKITIYRGMSVEELEGGDFGLSWTLKKEVAEFFAYTYIRNHSTSKHNTTVHSLTIEKKDVIAFINDRTEYEILYNG